MEFEKVIQERHSTRKFSDVKVEPDKIQKILEAGRIAPTAKNLQPYKVFVIESDKAIEKLDQATPCRYGAKTVLMVCGDIGTAFQKGEFSSYEMDACIVATHMMLEATNIGVQNIWIELFDEEVLRREFELEENLIPVCLIPIGYEDRNCPMSPNHLKRKNIEELVEYL